ncbi:hypothetical protein B0A48_01723 [Cryoendolithus antarcticus]|uniref:F-box domain-containing protein n=1 Tax=Cryoendolithus antarcticus TaxID=1507870 RepID=A0A1V8TQ69_9PEZI|nr:hypothetical protein B0A48_01723 [Cryoendolithus antarcticus]
MADSTAKSSAAKSNICTTDDTTTTALQVCDLQIPISGQRILLLDLPLEILQDIVERTDMLTTMRLVCKALEDTALDLFADEYLFALGCFIYDEDRWRRIKALTTSRLSHKIRCIELSNVMVQYDKVEDLDLKRFPVHRELLFVMAAGRVPVNDLSLKLYGMHHLEDLITDFKEELTATLATVGSFSITNFNPRPSNEEEWDHTSRVQSAAFLLKASGAVRKLYLDFRNVESAGGEMMSLLLANDFVCPEDLSSYEGHFHVKDLLVALTRARGLQKLDIYGMSLDGLCAGWQDFMSMLQAFPLLRSIQLSHLQDDDATLSSTAQRRGTSLKDVQAFAGLPLTCVPGQRPTTRS